MVSKRGAGMHHGIDIPTPKTWDTHPLAVAIETHMVGKRVVRILLECFLVFDLLRIRLIKN